MRASDLQNSHQVSGSSGNVAAGVAVASIPAVAGKLAWITGFEITASGSTAGLPVTVTITGLASGTLLYTFVFPAGVLIAAQPLLIEFPEPLSASDKNVAISVGVPSGGAGNTNTTVNIHGLYTL